MKLRTLVITLLFLAVCSMARAEIAADKRAEIEKMLRLTGVEKLVDQMMSQMITSMKPAFPGVPEEFWKKFAEGLDLRELIDQIIPIYDKHYSLDDLKAVNAFYETPVGQKVLSTLPQIMQESMLVGQAWGAKVGERAARAVAAERAKAKGATNP